MIHILSSILFLILNLSQAFENGISICDQSERSKSYLDVAADMITKAKKNFPVCPSFTTRNITSKPVDCEELLRNGFNSSGVYTIWPRSRVTEDKSIEVFCDMDTDGGGWTLLQRRGNFDRPKDFFFKDWASYKAGFGNIEKDFWLGNDNIFALSNQRLYSIRFDLKAVDGEKRYALYDSFWIDDETNYYTLHITEYSGNAGDSMTSQHNNQKFSTKDRENDNQKEQNCAQLYKGGWWYNTCHHANLNGLYLRGKHESFADGVDWYHWKGYNESLDTTEMKIRPKNFRKKIISNETPRSR